MLEFTRVQATAILVTVLVICGFAVPNFVSDETLRGWPDWAQRRIMLAPELQGGYSVLLGVEVDRSAVREYILDSLLRDVHDVLPHARIHLANRRDSVEVRPLGGDFEAALAKLRELSRTLNPVEVTNAGDGLILLTPTESDLKEYEPRIVDQSLERVRDISFDLFGLRATVEREGANRIRVRAP
jgi:preprotein translocase subunit SecD